MSSPGQRLYERFCGSEVSGSAGYWNMMNPAVKEDWERIGTEWEALTAALDQAAIVPAITPVTQFLRARIDAAHELLAKGEIRPEWRRT